MRKLLLSSICVALCATMANANVVASNVDNCGESDRVVKMGFGTAFLGLPFGPVGAILGFTAGSVVHDYTCKLNDFTPAVAPIVKSVESEVEMVKMTPDKIVKTYQTFALFDKNSIILNNMQDDILRFNNERIESIVVVGHASAPGTSAYNKELSLKRAIVIAEKLKNFIDEDKIGVDARGKSELISNEDYYNQRVELVITYKQ